MCPRDIPLNKQKEVHAKYQLENRGLYHNLELEDERLLSYFTSVDSTTIHIELVEFDIENNNTIKKIM